MKEKNYNLELVRMVSFVLVIAIHVSNYFCRAFGEIPQGEYLFSLVIDTAASSSQTCQTSDPFPDSSDCMECDLLSVEYFLYGNIL